MIEYLLIVATITSAASGLLGVMLGAHVAMKSRTGQPLYHKKQDATVWNPLLEEPKSKDDHYTP